MNAPPDVPSQGTHKTDDTLPEAGWGQLTPPASSSPDGDAAPSHYDNLNRERQPIVAAPTFPVLNESFAPPLSCTAADNGPTSPKEAHPSDDPRDHENIFTAGIPPMTTQKLARLKNKTKEAIKRNVHPRRHPDEAAGDDEAEDDDDEVTSSHKGSRKTKLASFVTHPRTAIKEALTSTIAEQVSDLNTPHVPHSAHSAFVKAHERKESALHYDDVQGAVLADKSIEDLEVQMRNMRMGVVMGRHIKRVHVVPHRRRDFPHKSEFLIRDKDGEVVRDELGVEQVDYLLWLGQYLIYMTQDVTSQYIEDWNQPPEPLTVDRLRCHIERIFIASQPWQHWLIHVRDVYRWKDPYETARWAILYCILWQYSQIVSFALGYMILSTLKNYFIPTTVSSLRRATAQAQGRTIAAQKLNQMLSHSGPSAVLSALESDLGPWAQLQLSDVANMLEVFNNFTEWHAPRATMLALIFFFSVFLVAAIGDRELCVRLVFFALGALFFGAWPIASHYPKYRYLVSPVKWAFWGVPTHAEWAFAELRLEAQTNRERLIYRKLDEEDEGVGEGVGEEGDSDRGSEASFRSTHSFGASPLDGAENIAMYSCHHKRQRGNLVVAPDGVRFEGHGKRQIHWEKQWKDLVEIAKVSDGAGSRLVGAEGLKLVFLPTPAGEGGVDGMEGMGMGEETEETVELTRMGRRRDEAFGAIVGFSGLKWQWCG
ncbi:hypothetical protein BZA05DRAFT_443716 [Tricharina praecox]|uniref:uncharacterized protein n=1 Tax=Tricharina praecox TaxID=43433 RepID=UPI002220DFF0|nr:uncharacterized protein BZA05DRAFT_443716 [Tricharina praecox]KAI5854196.1 hypothetical protein BZA05DRAFT_443716 [Tricharina praecox]